MPIAVYKPRGKTPLECVLQYKKHCRTEQVISYAGRLDPLAEGVLLLLVDGENGKRRDFEHLSKVYEVEGVFGLQTDSGDLMGMPTIAQTSHTDFKLCDIDRVAHRYIGTYPQRYHPYSSARVRGKPLFYWAREGKLGDIVVPTHEITIDSVQVCNLQNTSSQQLVDACQAIVPYVHGEFRQKEIVAAWLEMSRSLHFQQCTLKVSCARGGAYMRVLIEDIAAELGTFGFASSIKRTSVGPWNYESCLQLWENISL